VGRVPCPGVVERLAARLSRLLPATRPVTIRGENEWYSAGLESSGVDGSLENWKSKGGSEMRFKPLGERALVKLVEREQTTESGIVLPDTAKERPQTAEVVAVGQFENGVQVGEGDVIVFAKYSGTEITLDGEDYMILDADDILGVVES
jgi:chaperonin GroES